MARNSKKKQKQRAAEVTPEQSGGDNANCEMSSAQHLSTIPVSVTHTHTLRAAEVRSIAALRRFITFRSCMDAMTGSWRLWREHTVETAKSLLLVLRSACLSTVFAWLVMLCFSRGNILSGQAPLRQTGRMFEASVVLWSKLFSWLGVAATFSIPLIPQRFVSKPGVKPTFVACWLKVLRGTYRLVVCTTVGTVVILAALLVLPNSIREARLLFYFNAFWFNIDTVACNIEGTRIFEDETVRGQEKQRACPRRRPPYWKQQLRTIAMTIFNPVAYVVAAVYAHITSHIELDTPASLLIFAFASFALKIALQEVAKHYVFKQKVQNIASIAATVGVPTILIDTQTRIVLLLASTTSATLSGTLVMALIEIAMRCFKSLYVKRQIKREQARREAPVSSSRVSIMRVRVVPSATHPAPTSVVPTSAVSGAPGPAVTLSPSAQQLEDFDKWRQRLLHYHAAEVYVDMFAEYVALGCSYAILFFCWNHPKYMFSQFHDPVAVTTTTTTSAGSGDSDSTDLSLSSIFGSSQATVLVVQVSTEIVVDYASCLLEIGNGIDFRPLQRQSFFFTVWLMWAATGNISIAAYMYLKL